MKKMFVVLLMILGFVLLISVGERGAVGQGKKEPVKIGLLAEKTGGLAAYGYSHERVLVAAVNRVNKGGGIGGRPIELYVEDSESKPSVGALKFRKLVETNGVDFVFNSNSSGIAIACNPIAQELKTPYFPCSSASEISGEKGNRYVFQSCTNVTQESKGGAEFAIKNIGKKWVTVVVNYAWGWSNEMEFTKYITEKGGKVLKSVRVPLGTGDWLPYLKGNIPAEAEAVYFANFGSDFLSFSRDLHAVRPDIKRLGAVYAISAQDPKKLGIEGEGLYCITSYPTRLEGLNTKYNKDFRNLIGVDPDGKEVGTGKYFVLAYDWAVWQPFFALKAGIEKSGWKGREDTPKLIKTLEGICFKESVEFPQGDMCIRAQDHLAITGLYIEQIRKGELKVVARIPGKDATYTPPTVDFTKEPL
ncbi:MAG TPA: ABC transporter substrate-binding protein [Thermodesulfobacteriota bacterium]|nr:ABC transporter substrate-binding protein [Thermodesulfobacteriota bacterium]